MFDGNCFIVNNSDFQQSPLLSQKYFPLSVSMQIVREILVSQYLIILYIVKLEKNIFIPSLLLFYN